MPETKPLITGKPAAALKWSCHVHHLGLVGFGLLAWLVPVGEVLLAHLAFIPALIAVWRMNADSCPLNNLESLLTTGRWRDETNEEEGAFLLTAVRRYLGLNPTAETMNRIIYGIMGLAWVLSLAHYARLEGLPGGP